VRRRAATILLAAAVVGAFAWIRWCADAAAVRRSLQYRMDTRSAAAAPAPSSPVGSAAAPVAPAHGARPPGPRAHDRLVAAPRDTVELVVPAATPPSEPVAYPRELGAGDRLLIEAEGDVVVEPPADDDVREPAVRGDISRGALVAVFAGGSPFPIGREPLLWAAPAPGRLGFAVQGGESGRTRGGYTIRVIPLGPRGDARQRRFPAPVARFLPRREGGPLLELVLADRSGLGLDRGTLRVFLDTRDGERVVLTPWFEVNDGPEGADSLDARLRTLPADAGVPPGLHRVTATVADALGNESAPATVYLDRP
jgi:hypothetical protein